ncbi:MAG: DegT/DnrJ/EryC1/StrS family aminotransferase, partial [Gemmatimonadota bacterium]
MVTALRHDPPAWAPLAFGALARAAVRSGRSPDHAVVELEALLRQRFDAERVILFGSGTQALAAAIRAARKAAGGDRPVALPAFNCYDIAAAAIAADAPVLLYDIDPDTLGPDWASLRAALTAGAGAVVLASLYGYPIDWERATGLASGHGAILIEDAAQGSGGTWQGRALGSFGDLSVLSFGRGKGWTGGGGGALLLRHPDVHVPAPMPPGRGRGIRVATLAGAQWLLSNPRLYGVPAAMPWLHLGETVYHPLLVTAGISPFSAALLLE